MLGGKDESHSSTGAETANSSQAPQGVTPGDGRRSQNGRPASQSLMYSHPLPARSITPIGHGRKKHTARDSPVVTPRENKHGHRKSRFSGSPVPGNVDHLVVDSSTVSNSSSVRSTKASSSGTDSIFHQSYDSTVNRQLPTKRPHATEVNLRSYSSFPAASRRTRSRLAKYYNHIHNGSPDSNMQGAHRMFGFELRGHGLLKGTTPRGVDNFNARPHTSADEYLTSENQVASNEEPKTPGVTCTNPSSKTEEEVTGVEETPNTQKLETPRDNQPRSRPKSSKPINIFTGSNNDKGGHVTPPSGEFSSDDVTGDDFRSGISGQETRLQIKEAFITTSPKPIKKVRFHDSPSSSGVGKQRHQPVSGRTNWDRQASYTTKSRPVTSKARSYPGYVAKGHSFDSNDTNPMFSGLPVHRTARTTPRNTVKTNKVAFVLREQNGGLVEGKFPEDHFDGIYKTTRARSGRYNTREAGHSSQTENGNHGTSRPLRLTMKNLEIFDSMSFSDSEKSPASGDPETPQVDERVLCWVENTPRVPDDGNSAASVANIDASEKPDDFNQELDTPHPASPNSGSDSPAPELTPDDSTLVQASGIAGLEAEGPSEKSPELIPEPTKSEETKVEATAPTPTQESSYTRTLTIPTLVFSLAEDSPEETDSLT